jgi:aspartyl-tRNA(Asn)/glutamyl-tRNA(Gln) amidotransferase subunit C
MAVDEATTRRVAHLARIRVAEAELPALSADLSRILAFAEQLAEVDVSEVEPMTSVTPMRLRLRADAVTDGGLRDAVLANAPETAEGFFAVPKVVE